MEDISNRSLAVLLVAAIIVTLVGTTLSLQKIEKIKSSAITGMATGTGNVTLLVEEFASFTLDTSTVDFGTIYAGNTIWTNSSNSSWGPSPHNCTKDNCTGIDIRNDGNVPLNLSFNSTLNASRLINGTNPAFKYWVFEGNSTGTAYAGSCASSNIGVSTPTEVQAATNFVICNGSLGFNWSTSANKLAIEFQLVIPSDAPSQNNPQSAVITIFNH